MVTIIHQAGNDGKTEAILAAAQKRLGRYGYEKTTMSEIAVDVNLSKASLYYYFSDKETLWTAVLDKEQDEYFHLVTECMHKLRDPEEMIFAFVKLRHEHFTSFLNLTKFRFSDFYQIRPHFREMIGNLLRGDTEQVTRILEHGEKSGVFKIQNAEQTARLFLEILHGLRMIVIRNRPMTDLTQEDYDTMFKKHQDFLQLFIRGLKK